MVRITRELVVLLNKIGLCRKEVSTARIHLLDVEAKLLRLRQEIQQRK